MIKNGKCICRFSAIRQEPQNGQKIFQLYQLVVTALLQSCNKRREKHVKFEKVIFRLVDNVLLLRLVIPCKAVIEIDLPKPKRKKLNAFKYPEFIPMTL